MKKRSSFNLNIGASSILVIVIILCLVCFAGLSVASANADYQLSKKLSERTTAYYNAASQSFKDLYKAKKESPLADSFNNTYSVTDNQVLSVKSDLHPEDGTNYNILSFNIVTILEPDLDNTLPVFTGN